MFMHFPLHYFQTRLQAQAAGVPYQGLCGTPCIEANTVCKQQLFFVTLVHCVSLILFLSRLQHKDQYLLRH